MNTHCRSTTTSTVPLLPKWLNPVSALLGGFDLLNAKVLWIPLVALGLMIPSVASAKWVRMPVADPSTVQYLEDASVTRTGNIVRLTYLNDIAEPRHVITRRRNYWYQSQTFTADFDCSSHKYLIVSLTLHNGPMGSGAVRNGEGAYDWTDLSVGYPMWRTIFDYACPLLHKK